MNDPLVLLPLSKLTPSPKNVRTTRRDDDIEGLAASIEAHGLLQNLTVRPIGDGGAGTYEVVAGARRLAALERLAKEKRLAKSYRVPCRVLDGENAAEVSLAENVVRTALHPADQFDAFAALHADGLGAEAIAARFGVTPGTVVQRLKLAAVSSRLVQVYRDGEMSLEQLMAFTVSDDHVAQERAWFESMLHERHPHAIKRALTRGTVNGSDRRARFVGADAYQAAGGVIVRDLFDPDSASYFTDVELLERLVREQLDEVAQTLRAEGWSWVEILGEMDYGYLARFGRIRPSQAELNDDQQQRFEALSARHDEIVAQYGDDPDDDAAEELERLLAGIAELTEVQQIWTAEQKAQAGAIVCLDPYGELRVERGLATAKVVAATQQAAIASSQPEPSAKAPVHSDALLEDLSAHVTAGLRASLADQPDLALTVLVHTLVLDTFYGGHSDTCIDVRANSADLRPYAAGIAESPAAKALADRRAAVAEQLPTEDTLLWPWLCEQDSGVRLALLACCIAEAATALRTRTMRGSERRLADARQVARALGVDMSAWWRPTRETYFSRVAKAQILAAVREAVSADVADSLAGLKKDAMAARAEELLAGTTWLPAPLRFDEVYATEGG